MKDQSLHPVHPERFCWGCDWHCPADDLACGNGAIDAAHLAELFGDGWLDWAERRPASSTAGSPRTGRASPSTGATRPVSRGSGR